MSKKKHRNQPQHAAKNAQPSKKAAPQTSSGRGKVLWIVGIVIVAAVIILPLIGRGNEGAGSANAAPTPTPEEAKYIGSYLPEGYSAPKVAESGKVSETTKMTPVTAVATDTGLSISVSELAAAKIVTFEYQKADSDPIPMIAYVRPSGTVFVGVSYCIPCKGVGQWLDADGTLTCESCGTKRDPESGVGFSGACKLYPLDEMPAIVQGDSLIIDTAVLDTWVAQPLDRPVG